MARHQDDYAIAPCAVGDPPFEGAEATHIGYPTLPPSRRDPSTGHGALCDREPLGRANLERPR
jgi:hypothetical protein